MKNGLALITSLLVVTAMAVQASAAPVTLSDSELSTEFQYEWGPASVSITDIAGPGVQFSFTGLSSSSGTGVGDDFAVSMKAGGAWKDYGSGFSTYGDFSGYDSYELAFTNTNGECDISVNLKMNTGWTDSPWGTPARDTFWQDGWTTIGPGETKTVTLDFSSATVYNAADDPEYTQHADGTTGVAVWRLDEVSDIGFQVTSECEDIVIEVAEVPEGPPAPEFVSVLVPVAIVAAAIAITAARKK